MSQIQRLKDSFDAAGGLSEENATCYLQILLTDQIRGFTRIQHMNDMDEWGYSFRLGSCKTWFVQDTEDTKVWLHSQNIIDQNSHLTWKLQI